jgi:CheY-like chemotaxis protein
MNPKRARIHRILVVEDVQEMRDGIEGLLRRDGYWINAERNEEDAVSSQGVVNNSPAVFEAISSCLGHAVDADGLAIDPHVDYAL